MEAMNPGNLPQNPRAHFAHWMWANLIINYMLKKNRSGFCFLWEESLITGWCQKASVLTQSFPLTIPSYPLTHVLIFFFFLPSRGPSRGDILGNSTAPDLVIQSKIKIDPGPYLACLYHNDSKLKTQQPMSLSGAGEIFHPSKLEDMIHSLKLVVLLTNILFNNCFWYFFCSFQFLTLTHRQLLNWGGSQTCCILVTSFYLNLFNFFWSILSKSIHQIPSWFQLSLKFYD